MKTLIQRVRHAQVTVDNTCVGQIGPGLLLLVGVDKGDTHKDIEYHTQKVLKLRIFSDEADKMNRSVVDVAGGILVVSQFTLSAQCHKGTRPSFDSAMAPSQAKEMIDAYVLALREQAPTLSVETGQFGAMMQVSLQNDGPVTFMLESPK